MTIGMSNKALLKEGVARMIFGFSPSETFKKVQLDLRRNDLLVVWDPERKTVGGFSRQEMVRIHQLVETLYKILLPMTTDAPLGAMGEEGVGDILSPDERGFFKRGDNIDITV